LQKINTIFVSYFNAPPFFLEWLQATPVVAFIFSPLLSTKKYLKKNLIFFALATSFAAANCAKLSLN
jgi:hypothetical protein